MGYETLQSIWKEIKHEKKIHKVQLTPPVPFGSRTLVEIKLATDSRIMGWIQLIILMTICVSFGSKKPDLKSIVNEKNERLGKSRNCWNAASRSIVLQITGGEISWSISNKRILWRLVKRSSFTLVSSEEYSIFSCEIAASRTSLSWKYEIWVKSFVQEFNQYWMFHYLIIKRPTKVFHICILQK